ncbi:MAG TPA: hypothetical protein VF219_12095, partial [Vicinamibacterales bacterium]
HYILELSRDGALDRLAVRVESDPAAADRRDECDAAGRQLQHHIKSYIGVAASVVVCDPGSIERSVGKATRVVDRRSGTRV